LPTSSDPNTAVAAGDGVQPDADNLAQRVAARIRSRFAEEASGHDWHHIHRVWRLARKIAVAEGARLDVVELAALVHDIADWKFYGGDDAISFKGAGVRQPMRTLEGQCVQDADRLDAIGAIGIARCFAYGGHAGRLMYDPEVPPVLHATADAYKAAKGTSVNHFYEKLFLLKDRMNTATGHLLAQERHRYMASFVERFLEEWNVGEGLTP
jgi:uncharacterized protein